MTDENTNKSKAKIHSKTKNPDGSMTVVVGSIMPDWAAENRSPTTSERYEQVKDALVLFTNALKMYQKLNDVRMQEMMADAVKMHEEWLAELEEELRGKPK